ESTRAQNETDLLLCPFLTGQINGHIWTKACQYARKEKIERIKGVQARRARREIWGSGRRSDGRGNQYRPSSSRRLHEAGFAPCPRCCAGPTSCRLRAVPMSAR